jgi:hypothetical protein
MTPQRRAAVEALLALAYHAHHDDREDSAHIRLMIWIARREVDGRFARADKLREEITRHRGQLHYTSVELVGTYLEILEEIEDSNSRKDG